MFTHPLKSERDIENLQEDTIREADDDEEEEEVYVMMRRRRAINSISRGRERGLEVQKR